MTYCLAANRYGVKRKNALAQTFFSGYTKPMNMTGTLMKLCEVAQALERLDRDRQSLVVERDALIKAAWASQSKLDQIADCANLSRGRISQMMDPRPRGRPARRKEQTT
jgi:hypothetical protein